MVEWSNSSFRLPALLLGGCGFESTCRVPSILKPGPIESGLIQRRWKAEEEMESQNIRRWKAGLFDSLTSRKIVPIIYHHLFHYISRNKILGGIN